MRFYISDLHFCHGSLNENMDHRGFTSEEAMNEYMIQQWNSAVRTNDEVVILGDFCISPDAKTVLEILTRLNGRKYLIRGNHDKFLAKKKFDSSQFAWVEDYMELKDNKRKVILSHYPILCYNGQYQRDAEENAKTYMLYGHVHNTADEYLINEFQKQTRQFARTTYGGEIRRPIPCQMINCFCMFSDYKPLTLDEWILVDQKRRANMKREDYDLEELEIEDK